VTFQEANGVRSEAVRKRMTEAEFLAWQSGQDQRYELVDGVPRAMTGARIRHDIARGNADRHLAPQLRAVSKCCRPFSAGIAIRVYPGQLRRPELSVLCPPFDMEDVVSETPRLVLEVLSETTRRIDEHVKLDEYKGIGPLDYIILMSATEPDVVVWSRDEARQWRRKRHQSADDVIPLPLLEASPRLAILYDGVDLRPAFPERSRADPDRHAINVRNSEKVRSGSTAEILNCRGRLLTCQQKESWHARSPNAASERGDRGVQRRTRPHRRRYLDRIGQIVTADVHRLALRGDQFGIDLRLVGRERLGQLPEARP
jgi:Uma2 family endonuclease